MVQNRTVPGVRDRPGTDNNLFSSMMSRAVAAEAVLSNVLHYITQNISDKEVTSLAEIFFCLFSFINTVFLRRCTVLENLEKFQTYIEER